MEYTRTKRKRARTYNDDMPMQKKKKKRTRTEDEDRISKLSNDLIHHIMSFMDIRVAVQTSVLSKRWTRVWTSLPYLTFTNNLIEEKNSQSNYFKLVNRVFSRRNCRSRVLTLDLRPNHYIHLRKIKKYVKYAISHNVHRIKFKSQRCCALSLFKSQSLNELELVMKFDYRKMMKSVCWSLPNLTTLYFKSYFPGYCTKIQKFPKSCLLCLPALTTLSLEYLELPESLCLPTLTSLRLKSCRMPRKVWNFPALLSLELHGVIFYTDMSDFFLALTSLRNLNIDFGGHSIGCFVISSCELVTLTIRVSQYNFVDLREGKIVVLAPKLCNFNASGFFRTRFEGSELENVNIKFYDTTRNKAEVLKEYMDLFKVMFTQLGNTKILALDLATLQALSEIPEVLVNWHCPFYNLKYLKLPYGYDESSISSAVRKYLLSGSPSATIIRTLSPNMVENSVVDAKKVKEIEAPVGGDSNDRASTSWEKSCFVLWRGHEVNSEYVGLLELIMKRYPETFEKLSIKNKKVWAMKLNMLCSSVNVFTKTSMTEVDRKMLKEYKVIFADMQRWGFNIDWLKGHLKYIKHLYELYAIDSRIDVAKSKLQDVQTLHAKKLTDSESRRTMDTALPATALYIGDGLL